MKDITKYRGIIPAFYACYAPDGSISTERVKALTRHLIAKGVKGVYVGGSSGECIYQHPDERKAVLEAVMSEAKGKITVIAHVACNNPADSVELAAHAASAAAPLIARRDTESLQLVLKLADEENRRQIALACSQSGWSEGAALTLGGQRPRRQKTYDFDDL